MQRIPGLYFAPSALGGRGVFCAEDISKGSIIELCPIIRIPASEVDIIHQTELHDYYFVWGEKNDEAAIALGFGSLYNHSYTPNAEFVLCFDTETINIYAIEHISAGVEITFNYHGQPNSKDPLWFDESGRRIRRLKAFTK